ncbi:hypothetical protein J2D73_20035 [Acetobacter sacchari]|uniref:XRE family transcriptional regulator n=1 Tax=Acetobacter sacchari TaxID=2661687 RepID=A0ABS3M1T9_9PROT|nr:hypothetical protein [Acetobacter sacchari]MBO1362075.1 hypothetical protein [Acetobacter sacchari]
MEDKSDPVLPDVEAFLSREGMSATAFGKAAAGDPRLVHDLRSGRELRMRTRARICAFIEGPKVAIRPNQEAGV